jgi:hypothetical protein
MYGSLNALAVEISVYNMWMTRASSLGLVMRKILDIAATITLSTRAAVAGSSRRTLYTGVLCLAMLNPSSAQASQSIDYLKLYAHSRIVNYKEFQCFD